MHRDMHNSCEYCKRMRAGSRKQADLFRYCPWSSSAQCRAWWETRIKAVPPRERSEDDLEEGNSISRRNANI